jgi:hypothetical protein
MGAEEDSWTGWPTEEEALEAEGEGVFMLYSEGLTDEGTGIGVYPGVYPVGLTTEGKGVFML